MALEAIDYNQVTVGQPTEGGCVYASFTQAALPTDATTKASTLTGFESVGDISENGFTVSRSRTTNDFKDWNGDIVLSTVSEDKKQIKLEFLETSRPSVAKLQYGASNVTAGTDGSVASIIDKPNVSQTISMFVDELESNGYLRRTCLEKLTLDSIDDEAHQKGSLLVFGATFTCQVGADGSYGHIYRAKPTTA